MAATFFLSETVESRRDIRMRLKIDPLGNVFEVGYLSNDKLLTEVLMIYHERSVTDDMFDLDWHDTSKMISWDESHGQESRFEIVVNLQLPCLQECVD